MTDCMKLDGCCVKHSTCWDTDGVGECGGWPCPVQRVEILQEAKEAAKKRNAEVKRRLRETGTGWPA